MASPLIWPEQCRPAQCRLLAPWSCENALAEVDASRIRLGGRGWSFFRVARRRSGNSSRRRPKAKSLGVRASPGGDPARPEREPHSCSRLSRQVALSKKWMGIFAGEWPRGAPSPGRPGLSNLPCEAKRCVAALRAGDYAAADIIGFVTESSGSSDPVTLDLTGARLAGRSPRHGLPAIGLTRRRDDRADAGDAHQTLATGVLAGHSLNLRRQSLDALIEVAPVRDQVLDDAHHTRCAGAYCVSATGCLSSSAKLATLLPSTKPARTAPPSAASCPWASSITKCAKAAAERRTYPTVAASIYIDELSIRLLLLCSKHYETELCSPRDGFSPAVRIELGENGGDVKLGGVEGDS